MDAVTYPHRGVERRLGESFVAYRPQIDQQKDLARKFAVVWTPGLLFLDGLETLHHRAYGYHPPEEFEHLLHVGHGLVEFGNGRPSSALPILARAAGDAERTAVQPEALYWLGVCQYKAGDKEAMVRTWERLMDSFPSSLWALKASVLRPPAQAAA
jgi:hypothetical protein